MAAFWNINVSIGETEAADGVVLSHANWQTHRAHFEGHTHLLAFTVPAHELPAKQSQALSFSQDDVLPVGLSGCTFQTAESMDEAALTNIDGLETLARVAQIPVWKGATIHGYATLLVATPPPCMQPDQLLAEVFNGEHFLHGLSVWLFLRQVSGAQWTPPPPRACLIVDDPNLHGTRYGHLDFRKVVEYSREQNLHMSIASIPLDGWWSSPSARRLFQDNPSVLSLTVHGNNHYADELALPLTADEQCFLVHQAIERVRHIESASNVPFERIMVPPHGVCSASMLEQLLHGGFEALTTNRWSLWKYIAPKLLPADFGFRPADILGGGLPILSRFRFNSVIAPSEMMMASLLGQPIIPYGHHGDFKGNMAIFRSTVERLNTLKDIRWMSTAQILSSNFEHRLDSEVYRLRPYSKDLRFQLPDAAHSFQVELPLGFKHSRRISAEWRTSNASSTLDIQEGEQYITPKGAEIRIRIHYSSSEFSKHSESALMRPFIRRLLSELRDRASRFRLS